MQFRQVALADVCDLIAGFAFKSKDFGDYGSKVIKITHITPPVVDMDNLAGVNLENYNVKKLQKYIAKKGDFVLAMTGATIGKIGRIESGNAYINQRVLMFKPHNTVDMDYIYYVLQQYEFEQYISSHIDSQSAQPNISAGTIGKFTFLLPDLLTQKKIGRLLRSFDAKCETNRQINDNLQQQAQAVFAAWLATHTSIADEVTLGGICLKVTDGSHFSPKDEPSSKIPMLSVKDMEAFDFNLASCKHISDEDYQKMIANDCVPQVDDILVAKDGSYLKEIFICNEQRELAILSSIAIFRPDTSIIYPEILLAFLKSPRVLQEVRDNYVSGSALPRIVLKDFKKLQFLLPNLTAQEEIAPLLAAIRSQIAVNVAENQRLSQLRDALLPKLISGEIDISDIQL